MGQPPPEPRRIGPRRRLILQRNDGRPRVVEQRTAAGQVRAILGDGRAIEVSGEGVITAWPFSFDKVAVAGSKGFATSKDGRAFQTLDGGHTWGRCRRRRSREGPVRAPLCSALGCDLGGFLRLGWETAPPDARAEAKKVARGPSVALPPLLEMGCVPPAGCRQKIPRRGSDGSEPGRPGRSGDLPAELAPVRGVLARAPAPRPRAGERGDRGLGIQRRDRAPGDDVRVPGHDRGRVNRVDRSVEEIVVLGPSRAASSFRRELLFVEPLVPSRAGAQGELRSGRDLARALKDSGVSVMALVQSGNLDVVAAVPVTPAPAASARTAANGDVLVSFTPSEQRTLYLVARGGSAPRADMLFARPGDRPEARRGSPAVIWWRSRRATTATILQFGASGAAEVAKIPAPPASRLAPANPDAIAVGPRGEIAVLRTPSGSEPPSVADPGAVDLAGSPGHRPRPVVDRRPGRRPGLCR